MKISLGAKMDVYTPRRCMASGILLGRIAAGLASFERGLENKIKWSPSYAVRTGAESAHDASEQLAKQQTTVSHQLKIIRTKMEEYKSGSGYGFDRAKAEEALVAARAELKAVAQVVVKTCGKRRPEEGEGEALLEMKRIKRVSAPRPPKETPMELPIVVEESDSSSILPIVVTLGVVALIGANFLVR